MRVLAKTLFGLICMLILLLAGPAWVVATGAARLDGNWATASHSPSGLAPNTEEAIVQVYAARAFSWRGAFAVHSWIAAKPVGAKNWARYEVIGWQLRGGGSAVSVSSRRAPDAEWFGAKPVLLQTVRGERAARILEKLPQAAQAYPWADQYRAWPGPNSNTFIAWLGREIPELALSLPGNALGKDWLDNGDFLAPAPSGTGWQVSIFGLLGLMLAWEEGFEVNLLGLVFGLDPNDLAIVLPGLGTVSMMDRPD